MLNQSIITGRLTKDTELRKVNDRSVISFTLASSRDYKTEDGSYPADFIDCVLWGAPAESFNTLTAKTEVQVDKWYIVAVNQNQVDYPVKEETIVNDSLDNL